MSKKALCIKDYQDLAKLITGEEETIDLCLVDREICEDPENGWLQIIPYVSFFSFDKEKGANKILHYLRSTEGNEDRLHAKVSLGIGGHIDREDEIEPFSSSVFTDENGIIHYTIDKEALSSIIETTARRECLEELGIDVFETYNLTIDPSRVVFFQGNLEDDVNKVHLAASVYIWMSEEDLVSLTESAKPNEEIKELSILTNNVNMIVEELDYSVTMERILRNLKAESNFEDWSLKVFDLISRTVIAEALQGLTYTGMVKAAEEARNWKNEEVTQP